MKECPFCGDDAVGSGYYGQPWRAVYIGCTNCGAMGPSVGNDGGDFGTALNKAAELWDVRVVSIIRSAPK